MGKIIAMGNAVIAMYGEDSQYGLNLLYGLLKEGKAPRAVLVTERNGDLGEILDETKKLGGVLRKRGFAGMLNRIRERLVGVLMVFGLEERMNSESAFARAGKLKHLRRGLSLESLEPEKHGIEVLRMGINSQETIDYLNRNRVKAVLVATKIIGARTLRETKCVFVNAHPGYLPFQRGSDSVKWAVYRGMNPGATIHFIDEGIDTGRIIERKIVPISEQDSLMSLRLKARDECLALHLKYIDRIRSGKIAPASAKPQGIPSGPTRAMRLSEHFATKRKLKEMQEKVKERRLAGIKNPGILWKGE